MYTTAEAFKKGMGSFATGVTVLTVLSKSGQPVGITASSLTSVSLHPPLVLVCIGQQSERAPYFAEAERMAISILSHTQKPISQVFAKGLGHTKNFMYAHKDGLPVIPDAHVHLLTRIENRLSQGDHDILIAAVTHVYVDQDSTPLLYYRGHYGNFHPAA